MDCPSQLLDLWPGPWHGLGCVYLGDQSGTSCWQLDTLSLDSGDPSTDLPSHQLPSKGPGPRATLREVGHL